MSLSRGRANKKEVFNDRAGGAGGKARAREEGRSCFHSRRASTRCCYCCPCIVSMDSSKSHGGIDTEVVTGIDSFSRRLSFPQQTRFGRYWKLVTKKKGFRDPMGQKNTARPEYLV